MMDKFIQSWKFALGSWRIGLLVYLLLLLMVLPIGMQVYHVMEASIGNSLSLETLLKDYDHTVWMDLLHVHGASISPLLGQLRWILPFYMLTAVFLQGGLLGVVFRNNPQWMIFWQEGARWYFSFLKFAIFFLFVFLSGLLVIWLPFILYLININEWLVDETSLVWLFFFSLLLTILYFSWIFIWSVKAKFFKMGNPDFGMLKCIGAVRTGLVKNSISNLGLYFLISLPALVIWVFYYWLESKTGMVSPLLVWVFLVLQQLIILLRICLRISLYKAFSPY